MGFENLCFFSRIKLVELFPVDCFNASRVSTATTCAAAADCVPAFIGNACALCTCPNTAISRSSQEAYNGDLGGIIFWCTPGLLDTCGACAQVTAVVPTVMAPVVETFHCVPPFVVPSSTNRSQSMMRRQ